MKYFTIEELCRTATGLKNEPSAKELENLEVLVSTVLDPLRVAYGKPIRITSGYRSPLVNRRIGGVRNSQHMLGEAADIQPMNGSRDDMRWLYHYIKDNLVYDQLIWEYGDDFAPQWIHVSYKKGRNRMQTVRIR